LYASQEAQLIAGAADAEDVRRVLSDIGSR
jgi:hypothetical protein